MIAKRMKGAVKTMGEYIERDQAVRKAIDACIKIVGHGISQIEAVDIADEMDSIPTADVVEVRHGKWRLIEYEYLTCDKCGHWYYTGCESTAEAKEKLLNGEVPNHCPNCGAKMDGKGEG